MNLPDDHRIEAIDSYFGPDATDEEIRAKIDAMYSRSKVGDLDARMAIFESSKSELDALNDPFLILAAALRPEIDEDENRYEAFNGALKLLSPKLAMAHEEWKKGDIYPDANGTLRFNYGQVMGYSPADGLFPSQHIPGRIDEARAKIEARIEREVTNL